MAQLTFHLNYNTPGIYFDNWYRIINMVKNISFIIFNNEFLCYRC